MSSDLQPSNSSTPDQVEVSVTLLLAGGHEYTLSLPADAPLLKRLFSAVASSTANEQLFQVPMRDGAAALTFRGDRLVGMITEPPLIVQPSPTRVTEQGRSRSTVTVHQNEGDRFNAVLPSRCLQIEQFLTPEEHQSLLDYTMSKQAEFMGSSTSTQAADYRKSLVLHAFPEFAELMQNRIQAMFPDVVSKLGLAPFTVTQIEAQLTAHNDGHFYKVHNDNGSADTATRELTYVYYFYKDPKPFSGGELRIYDSKVENNYYTRASSFQDITPLNNSIVFFLSRYMHEVLPIVCPSRVFADSRFTINGWLRR